MYFDPASLPATTRRHKHMANKFDTEHMEYIVMQESPRHIDWHLAQVLHPTVEEAATMRRRVETRKLWDELQARKRVREAWAMVGVYVLMASVGGLIIARGLGYV